MREQRGDCAGPAVRRTLQVLSPKDVKDHAYMEWRDAHVCSQLDLCFCSPQAQLGSRGSSNSALSQMALGAAEAADGGGDLPTVMPSAPSASSGQGWKALGAAQGAKTLMTFRGTPLRMGCTILLKVL